MHAERSDIREEKNIKIEQEIMCRIIRWVYKVKKIDEYNSNKLFILLLRFGDVDATRNENVRQTYSKRKI